MTIYYCGLVVGLCIGLVLVFIKSRSKAGFLYVIMDEENPQLYLQMTISMEELQKKRTIVLDVDKINSQQ